MHSHQEQRGRRLIAAIGLNFLITLVQVIGGILSNSLSLISDALHNLSDGTSLLIAWLAGKYAQRKPDSQKTFGYRRAEILAALFNGIILIAVTLYLFIEAYHRFMNPQEVKGKLMLIVAVIGLFANLAAVLLLHRHSRENINLRAAYLHLFADTLSSVAVIIGGILMWAYGWYWIDPLITTLIGLYILRESYGILKETTAILMQSAPGGIDLITLQTEIQQVKGVRNLHHVHLWCLDDERVHFEAHLSLSEDMSVAGSRDIRQHVEMLLKEKHGIEHVTLQLEYNESCPEEIIAHQENTHKH
jgi:cobalt-zinc-cadmium efflux system protein